MTYSHFKDENGDAGKGEVPNQGYAFSKGWNWDLNPVWLIPKPQLLCQKEKGWLSSTRDFQNIELKVKPKVA